MQLIVFFVLAGFVSSCASVNRDPNVLSSAEFKDVIYLSTIDNSKLKEVGTISVTNSGARANILNTLPDLYRSAIKKTRDLSGADKKQQPKIYLTNLEFDSFTRREPYQVPYQDCKQTSVMKNVPYQNCSGFGPSQQCSTNYRMETVYENRCETKYKTEIRDVLYQRATASAYKLDEVKK